MDKLAEALQEESIKAEITDGTIEKLHDAGIEFTTFALNTFDGKTLKKALKVSAAVAEFTAQMERVHQQRQ